MIEQIRVCKKCSLCFNQEPLLDVEKKCQVFWVGLSAKKIKTSMDFPLSPDTNSGMLIKKIEETCDNIKTYKTNLVKCLPLNNEHKLRYPNSVEIDCCFENLIREIQTMSPQIVFLLGEKVYSAIEKKMKIELKKWNGYEYQYNLFNGIYYVPIHHPSYIYVYKRKEIQDYIDGVEKIITQLL